MSKEIRQMIDKVKNFKQFVNENHNQNKFDIAKLSREFLEMDNKVSELIKKEAWEEYRELKDIRTQKIEDLFKGNNPDEMSDEVHDAILSNGDGVAEMPNGYRATIIASYYNTIRQYYNTYAIVESPKNTEYIIGVPTYSKIKIGTIFSN